MFMFGLIQRQVRYGKYSAGTLGTHACQGRVKMTALGCQTLPEQINVQRLWARQDCVVKRQPQESVYATLPYVCERELGGQAQQPKETQVLRVPITSALFSSEC